MPRRPPGFHPFGQSGRGGPGSQAVRRVTPTNMFAYQRQITGVPLQPGQAQTILQSPPVQIVEAAGALYTSNSASTATSITTGSYTPTAGALQVAIGSAGNGGGAVSGTTSMTDSVAGTWTRLVSARGVNSAYADVWVKDAGSAPVAQTVTYTLGGAAADSLNLIIRQFTNALPAASQPGGISSGGLLPFAYSLAVTPTTTGSRVVGAFGTSSGQPLLTPTSATTPFGSTNGSAGGESSVFQATANSTASNPITLGFTNTPPANNVLVLAEIIPVAPSGAASGQVTVGPAGVGTVWYPAQATVSTTTGPLDTSTFNLYLGPAGVPITLVGTLFPGGAGTIALAIPAMSPGQYLIGVWSGGHAGDLASLNVIGTMDAVTV